MIRPAHPDDDAALCGIYNPFVRESTITFEVEPITESEMPQRITAIGAGLPWLILEDDGAVVAYAYATPWRARVAYRFSVESTVYVAPTYHRRGFGRQLYTALIGQLRTRAIHRVMGGIALPNAGSVGLHEALGFRQVAHFTEVGFKFGRWIDVGYWELAL